MPNSHSLVLARRIAPIILVGYNWNISPRIGKVLSLFDQPKAKFDNGLKTVEGLRGTDPGLNKFQKIVFLYDRSFHGVAERPSSSRGMEKLNTFRIGKQDRYICLCNLPTDLSRQLFPDSTVYDWDSLLGPLHAVF